MSTFVLYCSVMLKNVVRIKMESFAKTVKQVTFGVLSNIREHYPTYFFSLSDRVKTALFKRILKLCVKI